MGILRRKKIKKHINTITYVSIFLISAILVTVISMNGREKTEFMEMAETETYIVDVVSKERVNLAVVENQEEMVGEMTAEESTTIIESVTVAEEVTEKIIVEEITEDISKYTGIFVMNTSGNLNIRSKGDSSSEVVGVLTEGNGGEVIKYGTHWSKIKSGKVTGYVATEYILIGEKAEKALEENGYIATVNTDTLLVREDRNTDCTVLGMVANGSEFQCTKIYPKWVQIVFEGQKGYVSREFVKLQKIMTYAKTVAEIEAEQTTEATTSMESAVNSESSRATTSKPVAANSSAISTKTESTNASHSDKYLLACLVACEAGGESYEAKLAVASVVLNRVKASVYPSNIKNVIYQSGQFGPASNGSLDRMLKNGPDAGSQKAANAAIAGTNNVPGYLYFGRTDTINLKNLSSYRIIDHQVFY